MNVLILTVTNFLLLLTNIHCEIEIEAALKNQELSPLVQSYLNNLLQGLGPDLLDTAPAWLTPLSNPIQGELRLKKPEIEKAGYYIFFAFAAHCQASILEQYNCAHCNATGPDVRIVKVVKNDTFGTQAFITISDVRKDIVVAFRGSNNVPNFLQDLLHVPILVGNVDIRVHQGFLKATRSIYPSIVKTIKDLTKAHPDYGITVTGHSLGAAEAILTMYLFTAMKEFPVTNALTLITYGQPRVGNKGFVDYMNSLNISAARVVNRADVAPHYIAAMRGFMHTQNELLLNNGTSKYCNPTVYEDPDCSNSFGHLYSGADHLDYYDLHVITCYEEGANAFILKLVGPLQKLILPQIYNSLKPILDNILLQIEHLLG